MMFFVFLMFFAIFLEFPIPVRFWMDWNDNFFFPLMLSRSRPVLVLKKLYWCFLIFWIFLLFFRSSIFWIALELMGTISFSPILSLSHPFLASEEAIMMFFNFLIFMLFFWNSLFRVGLEWIKTRIFFFSHSQPLPSRFGFKRSHIDVF